MKEIDNLQFEVLTSEECLTINGGDKFMHDLGVLIGSTAQDIHNWLWEYYPFD